MAETDVLKRPVVSKIGDDFTFVWPDKNVGIDLEGVKETPVGLTADITIKLLNDADWQIHWSRLNLGNSRDRFTLSTQLNESVRAPWRQMIEQACTIANRDFRSGSQIYKIKDIDWDESRRKLVDPLFPEGETSVIFADGGSMKSLIGLATGLSVASGRGIMPDVIPTQQGRVLYLDWETTPSEQANRSRRIAMGVGMPRPDNIWYKQMYKPLADDVSRLRTEIERYKIDYVIVDSIAPACGSSPESSDVINRFFNALRSLSDGTGRIVTRLVISHINKSDADQEKGAARPFGSVFVQNLARSVWELRRSESSSTDTIVNIGMFHRKCNTGLEKARGVSVHLADESIRFERLDLLQDKELAGYLPVSYRIRESIKKAPMQRMTLDEIALAIDMPPDKVAGYLRRMPDLVLIGGGPYLGFSS